MNGTTPTSTSPTGVADGTRIPIADGALSCATRLITLTVGWPSRTFMIDTPGSGDRLRVGLVRLSDVEGEGTI